MEETRGATWGSGGGGGGGGWEEEAEGLAEGRRFRERLNFDGESKDSEAEGAADDGSDGGLGAIGRYLDRMRSAFDGNMASTKDRKSVV